MTKRDRTVIAVVAAIALVVGAFLLVVQPKRSKASKLATQVSAVQSQLSQVQSEITQGEAARRSFSGSYTVLARLGEAVPADDNVPSLIYQIQDAASHSRVDFDSLTLSGSGGGSSSPAPASGKTSASATQATTATLPPGASVGPAGFPIEPFTFTFSGNFFHLSDFFGRLEHFVVAGKNNIAVKGRLMTLDAINLAPGPNGFPNIAATVSATTFLLPANEGLTAGATPLGPAPQTASTKTGASAPAAAVVTPSVP
jgi:hypothetical protein